MVEMDFYYPRWGSEHVSWPEFLDKVKSEGYVGIEWFPFGEYAAVDFKYVLGLLQDRGLKFLIVMTVVGNPNSFEDYLYLLKEQLYQLSKLQPLFISAQVGREYYSMDQICKCLQVCNQVEVDMGIPIFQETHRNKWSYGIHRVEPILELFPNLKLTLDISHWYCVSESYLEDQKKLLLRVLYNVHHVHARIGHTQGSQIHDVSNANNFFVIQEHLKVWQNYLDIKIENHSTNVSFTTEFGPPPYLVSSGNRDQDYNEQCRQNLWIKNYMIDNLNLNNHG